MSGADDCIDGTADAVSCDDAGGGEMRDEHLDKRNVIFGKRF
jgi:hypothetical protein